MKEKLNKIITSTIDWCIKSLKEQDEKEKTIKERKQKILEESKKIKDEINNSKFDF